MEPVVLPSTISRCNTILAEVTAALFLGFLKMTPKLLTPKLRFVYIKTKRKGRPFRAEYNTDTNRNTEV